MLGVGLNYVVPREAFEIVLNFAAIGILTTWGMIMICHLLFWPKARRGELTGPSYRLPGSPWTEIVTLGFLASVLVLMCADGGAGRITVCDLPRDRAGAGRGGPACVTAASASGRSRHRSGQWTHPHELIGIDGTCSRRHGSRTRDPLPPPVPTSYAAAWSRASTTARSWCSPPTAR